MPVSDFQEFQERYYKIINNIVVEAIDKGRLKLNQASGKFNLDLISDEFDTQLQDLKDMAIAAGLEGDIGSFKFEIGNPLLGKGENLKIFQYFHDIDNGNNIEVDIDELDIPDVNKQEIQAQGFVKAFDKMKEKGDDLAEFQKYYKNVQKLSMQSDLLEVENPEISSSLDRANGVFNNFNRVKEKYDTERRQQEVFGGSDSVVSEPPSVRSMLDKAEKAYDFQHGLRIKLAKHIALNNIPVFDENGEISTNFDELEVGNIFEGSQITGGIGDYLKKSVNDLITDQSEVTKLNKVFNALDIDGQNIDSFRKLVAEEKAKIEAQRQRESENRRSSTVETDVRSQSVDSSGRSDTKEQKLINLKENLAKKILKVAGVSDKQIARIMNNPKMKAAMMNRAERLLKDLEVNEKDVLKIGPNNAMSKVKDQDLQEKIEDQVEELVAQVGRTSVTTIETRDMRGRENLHDKYQDKAKKLDQKAFDKKMGEALEYENKKNNRNKGESFLYNTFYRKPLQLVNALRPADDKPLLKPWQKVLVGVIALAVLAPPANIVAAVLLMGKALDEVTATQEKPGWLTRLSEKIFGKGEEREVVNNTELEKINVKDLLTEVSQDRVQDREQDRGRDREQDRGRDREQDRDRDREQDRVRDREQDRGRDREQDRDRDREQDRVRDREQDRDRDREQDRVRDREQDRDRDRGQERQTERQSRSDFDEIIRSSPDLRQNLSTIGSVGSLDSRETAQERIKHTKQGARSK